MRALDSAVRYTNFPVEAARDRSSRNFTAKFTYQLSQNNKLIGYYQPSTKVQNEPARSASARLAGRDSHHRHGELPAGLLAAALEGRVQPRDQPRRRSSRSAPASSATSGPTRRTAPGRATRTSATASCPARRASRQLDHPAHAGARLDELLQERAGRQPQLQGRLGMVPGNEHARARRGVVQRRAARAAGTAPPIEVLLFEPAQVGERAVHAGPLRHRHVAADQPADAQPRRPLRPLSELPARAGARRRSVHARSRSSSRRSTTSTRGTWSRRGSA